MLNQSPYRNRYLFTLINAMLLLAFCAFVLLDTFVFVKLEEPIAPIASLTFAPVATPEPEPIETVYTDTEYIDANIQIKLTTHTEPDLVYYVADIRLNSLEYFKTAFAKNKYGRNIREATSTQARNNNAILAINGDYCGYDNTRGLVIRNGTLYRDTPHVESLVLMNTGEMIISPTTDTGSSLIERGAIHSWSFGPTLVTDGEYANRSSRLNVKREDPRTGLGMIEPYHYVFIVVDGRSRASDGLNMKDFAQLFIDLGCTVAYNLDGGGTATMVMNDKVVNKPCYGKERNISDIIYIGL